MVFVDIDDHRLDPAVVLKGLGLRIVAVQSLHGAYPDVTCLVAVDGIAAVVIERVGIVAVNVMPHIARLSVEHENTVAIGADPEILPVYHEGMRVALRQIVLMGIVDETLFRR